MTTVLDVPLADSITFFASAVASDETLQVTYPAGSPAAEVAASLASRLRLPGDVRWLMRRGDTADVVDEGPIAGQIAARAHIELMPMTHLG